MNKWKIWFRRFNSQGQYVGAGALQNEYTRKQDALRKARMRFGTEGRQGLDTDGDRILVEWTVSQTNPYVGSI